MRPLVRLFVLALAAPLGGCYGVTTSGEIPAWAMATGAGHGEPAKPARRIARPRAVAHDTAADAALVTGSVRAQPRANSGPTAYTPEWFAQEQAADERLRRQLNICRGC
jgi:hypothetical protein